MTSFARARAVRHGLVLGLELRDVLRGSLVREAVHVDIERGGTQILRGRRSSFAHPNLVGSRPADISRHHSGRHALVYDARVFAGDGDPSLDVRIYDHARRIVPRRLQIPLAAVGDPHEDDGAAVTDPPLADRVRRPSVFPGAGYDLVSQSTGLRGRVLDAGGDIVRWARIEIRRPLAVDDPGPAEVVARAHGDDRGEFLAVLPPGVVVSPETITASDLEFDVFAFAAAAGGFAPGDDPLSDLPLERLADVGVSPDEVAAGTTVPATYSRSGSRTVAFQLARMLSGAAVDIEVS